jgi:hypothetical protein
MFRVQMEKPQERNISITTRLVDAVTAAMLLKVVSAGAAAR